MERYCVALTRVAVGGAAPLPSVAPRGICGKRNEERFGGADERSSGPFKRRMGGALERFGGADEGSGGLFKGRMGEAPGGSVAGCGLAVEWIGSWVLSVRAARVSLAGASPRRSVVFDIAEAPLGNGWIGISPAPGRGGAYQADLTRILQWGADMVLTMTTSVELERLGAADFGADLDSAGVVWRHLPIPDFGAPPPEVEALWPEVSAEAHGILARGGRVLAHCYGGCGRSGMALMRLMVEAGEEAEPALARLRDVRPCAVEMPAQQAWAAIPMFARQGWTS